jgi:uridine phosphorylase
VELSQVVRDPTLIRIGSCGALQPSIRIGDLVISSAAVRLENTTTYFVCEGFPAFAHHEVLLALIEAAAGRRSHVGITASAPGFYGAQGRRVPGFPPRFPDLPRELARQNVANFEMEISALLTLAALRGLRAGAACAVFADRGRNRFISPAVKKRAESDAIDVGLQAVRVLARIDREKKRRRLKHWYPDRALV